MRLGARLERAGLRNVEIRAAASGAPKVFFEGECAPLSLSLSHRAGLGACVIGTPGMALGCDLEFVEPHSATFAADYFSTLEQELVMAAGLVNRDWFLALLWSAKESALKALQEGLRLDTRSVNVADGFVRTVLATSARDLPLMQNGISRPTEAREPVLA